MSEAAPAQFYTGLVAEAYRHLRGTTFDPAPYERFVRRYGEPALELGCGDGDPLLDLVDAGLQVEGLDASADMLDRAAAAAKARGLEVVLHHATFQEMDLGKRYGAIYFAGPTFNLLVDDERASAALAAIACHLADDGVAMVPIFEPEAAAAGDLGRLREQEVDAAILRVGAIAQVRDEAARLQTTTLRYERETADGLEAVERDWVLHWHSVADLRAMAEAAGLRIRRAVGGPTGVAGEDDTTASVLLERA